MRVREEEDGEVMRLTHHWLVAVCYLCRKLARLLVRRLPRSQAGRKLSRRRKKKER